MEWIDANKGLPTNLKNYYIKYNLDRDQEIGDYWYIKDLVENGWTDVKWLKED